MKDWMLITGELENDDKIDSPPVAAVVDEIDRACRLLLAAVSDETDRRLIATVLDENDIVD